MSASALEQQVNLYQPILGAERRLFSAQAIGVALAVLVVSLAGLAAYGSRRTSRIERAVAELASQEAASMALVERASMAGQPTASLAELDAEAKNLSAEIDARQRALDIVKLSSETPATGFAARLEALARQQLDGVWLNTIVVGSGAGRLAMRGGATDSRLLPQFLGALAHEPALAGVHFDKLAMRQALPGEAPAHMIFELDGPDLPLPKPERKP